MALDYTTGLTGRLTAGDEGPLLPAKPVCERYRIRDRTLDRWLANEALQFPRPIVINGRRYFWERRLETWLAAPERAPARRNSLRAENLPHFDGRVSALCGTERLDGGQNSEITVNRYQLRTAAGERSGPPSWARPAIHAFACGEPRKRSSSMQVDPTDTAGIDVVWGAGATGQVIGLTERQAYQRLEQGQISCARKIGNNWAATRQALIRLFAPEAV